MVSSSGGSFEQLSNLAVVDSGGAAFNKALQGEASKSHVPAVQSGSCGFWRGGIQQSTSGGSFSPTWQLWRGGIQQSTSGGSFNESRTSCPTWQLWILGRHSTKPFRGKLRRVAYQLCDLAVGILEAMFVPTKPGKSSRGSNQPTPR